MKMQSRRRAIVIDEREAILPLARVPTLPSKRHPEMNTWGREAREAMIVPLESVETEDEMLVKKEEERENEDVRAEV
jgi:hypothetical protein